MKRNNRACLHAYMLIDLDVLRHLVMFDFVFVTCHSEFNSLLVSDSQSRCQILYFTLKNVVSLKRRQG